MTEGGATPKLRDGRWRRLDPGWLGMIALVAALSDVVTTAMVLIGGYDERNVLLVTLADVHVGLAIAVFGGFALGLVAVAWLSLGWLSTVAGTYTVLGLGTGGLNNTLGFLIDVWPLTVPPVPMWVQIHVVLPPLGLALGICWTASVRGWPPRRELATVVPAVIALSWGVPLIV